MQRTVDEVSFTNVTLNGEFGFAEIQTVKRLVDTVTGEKVGAESIHRHVLTLDDDDTGEAPEVQRARSGFDDAAMRQRWIDKKAQEALDGLR